MRGGQMLEKFSTLTTQAMKSAPKALCYTKKASHILSFLKVNLVNIWNSDFSPSCIPVTQGLDK